MPYQANQPFFYSTEDGVDHFVARGSVVADKDPVLKGRELLFDKISAEGKKVDAPAPFTPPDLPASD